MNKEEIMKHPLMELFKQTQMYLEEPGDPIWEKIRFRLEAEFKMSTGIINETIWKAMVFDCLHKAFKEEPDAFNKRPEFVKNMLVESFNHLDNFYKR